MGPSTTIHQVCVCGGGHLPHLLMGPSTTIHQVGGGGGGHLPHLLMGHLPINHLQVCVCMGKEGGLPPGVCACMPLNPPPPVSPLPSPACPAYLEREVIPLLRRGLLDLVERMEHELLHNAAGIDWVDGQYLPHNWTPFSAMRWAGSSRHQQANRPIVFVLYPHTSLTVCGTHPPACLWSLPPACLHVIWYR